MASTGEFIGRRVGRFTITSHLASGGMAELFIARQEAVGGFEKDLVLKMLQERYARNARVVEMFLDEARLAAKLNHQNIVHVYDVDESDGVRYIAMEYIHGETVTDIVRRSIARGGFLPLEHATHIVAETAAGLAYAHERRDSEGRPARIVHRDVSPSNILVTYEGLTKIVDFGIARVQDQIREESGMRPGKVSYMAPEQVRGEGADHRSDIFSLGIILYEITVGRRLWRGPPEVVMRRIVEELIPPPTYVRRGYPPALELIVMKALERRPADRHQSAAELQNELNEFMEEAGLKSGSRRLSAYMKELFAPDAAPPRAGDSSEPGSATVGRAATSAAGPATPAAAAATEDLDFDRRAPLMMRVEARADDGGVAVSRGAPVPPLGDRAGAADGPSNPAVGHPRRSPSSATGMGGRSGGRNGGAQASLAVEDSPSPIPLLRSVGERSGGTGGTGGPSAFADDLRVDEGIPALAGLLDPKSRPIPALVDSPLPSPLDHFAGPRSVWKGGQWVRPFVLAAVLLLIAGVAVVVFLAAR